MYFECPHSLYRYRRGRSAGFIIYLLKEYRILWLKDTYTTLRYGDTVFFHTNVNIKMLFYFFVCRSKKKKTDIFSLIKSEERASTSTSTQGGFVATTSSFTTRVSGGQSRRTTPITEGDFYVEVKLYNLFDVQNTPPEERFKKALTSVKLRLGDDCREWDTLQEFLITAFKLFKNSNPTKFSDRINFK